MGGHFAQESELQLVRVAVFLLFTTLSSLRNMAGWEPAVDVLVKLDTLKEVAQLVAMPANVSSSLFATLGATGKEHPSVLGIMEAEEIAAELSLKLFWMFFEMFSFFHIFHFKSTSALNKYNNIRCFVHF